MYTRKSLLNFEFFWTKSKFGFELFLTKCLRKAKSRFLKTLSPGVSDLVDFSQKKNNFFVFRKDALRLGSNIFETFRFAPRKMSLWNNSFLLILSPTNVLYQLVNLVLETCFIFSKTLNLSKTCFVLNFSSNSISRTTSIMISLFQIIFGIVFKKVLFLGYFYKTNCGVHLGFLALFQKDVKLMICKNKSCEFRMS